MCDIWMMTFSGCPSNCRTDKCVANAANEAECTDCADYYYETTDKKKCECT
jgi:hypothetical protein